MRDPSMRPTPFQAYVRIMIGCDKFCTYCIVPSVRGPEQSRPPEHIAAEVRQLAAEGCKEITLLSWSNAAATSYRPWRRPAPVRLGDLLAASIDTPGIERIKFVTNFPRDCWALICSTPCTSCPGRANISTSRPNRGTTTY